ncbi:MAG: hypothetical protein KKI06_09920 [Euryarchaeota archaeon]|nr:hypothetical protein [Euryarchaeota archaeon]MBU4221849.1 hypothetical protein [Euryarchaeota archaeon]MCG2737779.1 hypothetical protein [Candidatus Methanoperedenaceae archaeon]
MVKVEVVMDERALLARAMLNLRLIKLSWALFLILIGASWILESLKKISGDQMWALLYAGTGIILLLLNLLRVIFKLNFSRFTIGLGVLGVLMGVGNIYSPGTISIWAAIVLIIGLSMLLGALKK